MSKKIKNEATLISEIKDNLNHFLILPKEVKVNKAFILKVLDSLTSGHREILREIAKHLINDEDILIKAIEKDAHSLKYASNRLKNNNDIVLMAVKINGLTLVHASESLRNNKEIVMNAVKNNSYALNYAAEDLKKDKEIALAAIKNHKASFNYLSKELKNEIGKNDPIKYLESYLLSKDLEQQLNRSSISPKKLKV